MGDAIEQVTANAPPADATSPEEHEDSRLYEAFYTNPAGVPEFLSKVRPGVISYARRRGCRDPESAWTETLIRVLARVRRGVRPDNPLASFRATRNNVVLELLRGDARHPLADSGAATEAAGVPEVPDLLLRQHLQKCFSYLRERDRRLLAAVVQGEKGPRAWALFGLSDGAYNQAVFKARNRLRKCLERRGVLVDRAGNVSADRSTSQK